MPLVSGCQDTYLSSCSLILVVKRYMSAFPNFATILWKRTGLSFHSVGSYSALDCLSASIFIVPGECATATHY